MIAIFWKSGKEKYQHWVVKKESLTKLLDNIQVLNNLHNTDKKLMKRDKIKNISEMGHIYSSTKGLESNKNIFTNS